MGQGLILWLIIMNKLNSIQFLRGFAAVFVVAFHFRVALNDVYAQTNLGDLLFSNGAFGVDLFFVISGFIIHYSTMRDDSCSSFAIKRFFRIYPVYIFAFLFYLFFVQFDFLKLTFSEVWFNYSDVIKSVFFITSDMSKPGPFYGYGLLYPAWTLTYELYFYFIFMICMFISHKHRALLVVLSISLISICGQLFFSGSFTLDPYSAGVGDVSGHIDHLKFSFNPIVFDFLAGVLISCAYQRINNSNFSFNFSLIKFITLSVLTFSIISIVNGYKSQHGVLNSGMIASMLFISMITLEGLGIVRFWKFFSHIGDLSYSLYLIHVPILWSLNRYGDLISFYPGVNGVGKFITNFVIAYALSLLMYTFIEKPSINMGKAFIKKFKQEKSQSVKSYA